MEEKRHGGAGRVIVVILILAVLLAAGAFFLFGGRVRVETPSFSTGYRYDRAKDYATLDTFPVEGVTADKVELHWISGRVEIRAAETISVSENFAGDNAQRLRWRLDGDTLIVQPCASGAQELPEKTLTVTLPQTVLLKVDTVSADCALTVVQTAQLDVDSVSGALRGDAAVTEMLSVDTVSGGASLDLTAAPKKVTGNTVSGVMELVFDEAPGTVKLSSTSGSGRGLSAGLEHGQRRLRCLGLSGPGRPRREEDQAHGGHRLRRPHDLYEMNCIAAKCPTGCFAAHRF